MEKWGSEIRPPEGHEDLDPHNYPCSVSLLGPIHVFLAGKIEEGGWRRKSLELLAYLVLHPGGASRDQILETLWPGADPKVSQCYLWQSVTQLRSRIAPQNPDFRIIQKVDDFYRADLSQVWVDIVAFEAAVNRSSEAEETEGLLSFACALYKGEVCEGRYFSWTTLIQERLSGLFVSAARLAETLVDRQETQEALLLLDRALERDPYDEALGRDAIALEAMSGRADQVVRRYRRLRRLLLEDLGVEPSRETQAVLKKFLG
jgi:DNA-binding SARP family transcriptional activator